MQEMKLGAKVRALRRRENLNQASLAEHLGISPSYLNLIEHDRRPLTAPLLIKIAQLFKLDVMNFATDEQSQLVADLTEVFADPLFENYELTNTDMRELATSAPGAARGVLALYQAYRDARESAEMMATRMFDSGEIAGVDFRLPSEEVSEFIQKHFNYFPELELAAETLWREAKLSHDELYPGMVRYLSEKHRVTVRVERLGASGQAVRRYDPERRELVLSEILAPRSRNFQVAHQIGLLTLDSVLNDLVDDPLLTNDESRALGRVALANYFAGAVRMPYLQFLEAARNERYDIEVLGHRFRSSFEQVCHRMTTLRRPGAEGVPFHMIRIDVAGNISKRFSASGIRFARFSGVCPRWNVCAAFLTPGMIRAQLSQTFDGRTYFCISCTIPKGRGGYHSPHAMHAIGMGCEVKYARELVYADGVDLENLSTAVPIGVTCRLCERMDCEQRAFPPLQHPLKVNENLRGLSFYAPPVTV